MILSDANIFSPANWLSVIPLTRFMLFDSINFFFNDTATTEIYTLSLHDALPIPMMLGALGLLAVGAGLQTPAATALVSRMTRSEVHTSELQSQSNLVCRLLL